MPTAPHFNDPEQWHQRAEEARALAEHTTNERAKKTMFTIADDYDELAAKAAIHVIDETIRVIDEIKGS